MMSSAAVLLMVFSHCCYSIYSLASVSYMWIYRFVKLAVFAYHVVCNFLLMCGFILEMLVHC